MRDVWTIELDTIDCGCITEYYPDSSVEEVVKFTQEELAENGGGHADIYDSGGNFVEDVEV